MPGKALPDRLLTWAGVAMIAAALYLLIFGGAGDGEAGAAAPPPTLQLTEAIAADGVLTIRFDPGAPISLRPGGWGTDDLHLHARLDSAEVMPGPTDVRRLDAGQYEWSIRLPTTPPDTVTLYWSDQAHLPIGATERSRPVGAAPSGRAQN